MFAFFANDILCLYHQYIIVIKGNGLNITKTRGEGVVGFDRIYIGAAVDRDDLEDGGSAHFAKTVGLLKIAKPELLVECLVQATCVCCWLCYYVWFEAAVVGVRLPGESEGCGFIGHFRARCVCPQCGDCGAAAEV